MGSDIDERGTQECSYLLELRIGYVISFLCVCLKFSTLKMWFLKNMNHFVCIVARVPADNLNRV